MNIAIGEKYRLTSDKMNVIVNERYEKQVEGQPSGEYDFKAVAFTGKLEQACLWIMQREINVADAENLSELVGIIQDAKKRIQDAMNIMTAEKIQEQRQEIRSKNTVINRVKALQQLSVNQSRDIDPYELLEAINGPSQEVID